MDHFGGIDVLHNNVGVLEANFTDQLTVDVLPEDVWETCTRSTSAPTSWPPATPRPT